MSYQRTKRTTSLSFWCLDWCSIVVSVEGNVHPLNAKDAFPRSQTTSLRLHYVHDYEMVAYEVDARISSSSIKTFGQCDSSLLEKSAALLFFLIVPLITLARGRVLVVLPPARSQGLSAGLSHDAWRLPEAAKTIPGTTVTGISFRSFHLGELSSYPQTSNLHFVRGSQEMLCWCFS